SLIQYFREISDEKNDDNEKDDLSPVDKKDESGNLDDEDSSIDTEKESEEIDTEMVQNVTDAEEDLKTPIVIKIDASKQQARMIINNWEAIQALHLNISKHVFERHQLVGLLLDGICADFVPSAVNEFNATEFE
ncbi:unnamed protein product, partial [Onchocerca ochengi]